MNALFVGGPLLQFESRDLRNVEVLQDKELMVRNDDGTYTRYRIRKGSRSDEATIPQVAWSLGFTPFGDYALAAVTHDCAYQDTLEVWNGTEWVLAHLTKAQSDELINALMFALGVPKWQRVIIYEALVAFGWPAFNEDRRIAAGGTAKP